MVQGDPGATLEVIEPKLFFQLLVGLLAGPSSLDGTCDRYQWSVGGMLCEIIFDLSTSASFADEPNFFPGQAGALWNFSPSAARTRTAANSAVSGPLVPTRQESV